MSELEYFLSVKNIEISLYAQAQQSLLLLTQGNIYNRLSPGGGGGGFPYETDGDARRLA